VLANGELIETGPVGKRELNKKMGHSTLEGAIYRGIDALLEENADLIAAGKKRIRARHNSVGYNIFDVKQKHGIDLTPLFIGSQGSLGIITEATLEASKYNPVTKVALASFDNLDDLHEVLPKILALKPSILDMMNRSAVDQISRVNPNQLKGLLARPQAAIHLFVEFDNVKDVAQKKAVKQLKKIVEKAGGDYQIAHTPEDQDKIWKVRQSVTTILTQPKGQSKAVPVAEDVSIPVDNLVEFMHTAAEIYASSGLVAPAWGHAGDGVVRMQPMLDLGQLGDRQKLFKLTDGIYRSAIKMEGSISASAGDGRVRAPYSVFQYGHELHDIMLKIKKIFDPYGILNPGVKTAHEDEVKALLRGDYSLVHRHEYLPRS
jgi:FAD/FMN-containing dehydrogenase